MKDPAGTGRNGPRILEQGVTCWRIARADRVAVLIDAASYYLALLQALRQARSSIIVLGWDFDPEVRLDPTDPASELRRLLPALAERRPELHVHLLIWDVSVVFGPSSPVNQLSTAPGRRIPGSASASTGSIRSAPLTTRSWSASTISSRSPAALI